MAAALPAMGFEDSADRQAGSLAASGKQATLGWDPRTGRRIQGHVDAAGDDDRWAEAPSFSAGFVALPPAQAAAAARVGEDFQPTLQAAFSAGSLHSGFAPVHVPGVSSRPSTSGGLGAGSLWQQLHSRPSTGASLGDVARSRSGGFSQLPMALETVTSGIFEASCSSTMPAKTLPQREHVEALKAEIGIEAHEDGAFGWIAEYGLDDEALPPRWKKQLDPTTNAFYYVEIDSQTTRWENPLTPFLQRVVATGRLYLHERREAFWEEQKAWLWSSHKQDLEVWQGPLTDGEGRFYFQNAETGATMARDPRVEAQFMLELEVNLLIGLQDRLPRPGASASQSRLGSPLCHEPAPLMGTTLSGLPGSTPSTARMSASPGSAAKPIASAAPAADVLVLEETLPAPLQRRPADEAQAASPVRRPLDEAPQSSSPAGPLERTLSPITKTAGAKAARPLPDFQEEEADEPISARTMEKAPPGTAAKRPAKEAAKRSPAAPSTDAAVFAAVDAEASAPAEAAAKPTAAASAAAAVAAPAVPAAPAATAEVERSPHRSREGDKLMITSPASAASGRLTPQALPGPDVLPPLGAAVSNEAPAKREKLLSGGQLKDTPLQKTSEQATDKSMEKPVVWSLNDALDRLSTPADKRPSSRGSDQEGGGLLQKPMSRSSERRNRHLGSDGRMLPLVERSLLSNEFLSSLKADERAGEGGAVASTAAPSESTSKPSTAFSSHWSKPSTAENPRHASCAIYSEGQVVRAWFNPTAVWREAHITEAREDGCYVVKWMDGEKRDVVKAASELKKAREELPQACLCGRPFLPDACYCGSCGRARGRDEQGVTRRGLTQAPHPAAMMWAMMMCGASTKVQAWFTPLKEWHDAKIIEVGVDGSCVVSWHDGEKRDHIKLPHELKPTLQQAKGKPCDCGTLFVHDDGFCHKCGAKKPKEEPKNPFGSSAGQSFASSFKGPSLTPSASAPSLPSLGKQGSSSAPSSALRAAGSGLAGLSTSNPPSAFDLVRARQIRKERARKAAEAKRMTVRAQA
eukprot:TRINITY_DN103400_c0_g1_i1.p1 TRINITY_DN103400_c0_g1~~TRINITY_DN103400_c0_g1_i1.p1  ORF type:complete len:1048 (+),score=260.86 TRINITY_DN103400_c0_g1_i1:50-3145(+)